jgi:hypothetical protein
MRDKDYTPSEHSIRLAKAAFVAERHWTPLPRIATVARLIFDSLQQPAVASVRSSQVASKQVIYQAEPFVIDLRLEAETGRQKVSLIGQILNSRRSTRKLEGVSVILLSGDREVAKTATNAQGEFDFEFENQDGLQLHITIGGQKAVGIILPPPGEGSL